MTPEFIAGIIATGVLSILGYLLAQKDKQQEDKIKEQAKLIETLFRKHDEDAARLDALKLQIAERHYGKDELDRRFDRIEGTMRTGFDSMLSEVRNLSASLMAHIQEQDRRQ